MSMLLIWSWLYRFTGLVITHQRPSLVWASQTSYWRPRTYSLVSFSTCSISKSSPDWEHGTPRSAAVRVLASP